MENERSIIEGGASAATCTCGDDLARNGFTRNGSSIHNYACPRTPKCRHMAIKRNEITGQTIQAPCGSRLEPEFACHSIGCPELPLCPHCGTPMDRRGVHSIGCPNHLSYSHQNDDDDGEIQYSLDFQRFFDIMNHMLAIPPRNPVSSPQIIGGDFAVQGDCSICHDQCDESQSVMKPSGCDHCFHAACLTPWIQDHSTCPSCRGETRTILRKN